METDFKVPPYPSKPYYYAKYHRNDENVVEYCSERESHQLSPVSWDGMSQAKLTWGYRGNGPTNTARTILRHVVQETDVPDINTSSRQTLVDFTGAFLTSVQKTDDWLLMQSEVTEWIENYADG